MVRLVFLTSKFFDDYKNCPEIETKQDRPYVCAQLEIDGITYCVPLRSNVRHEYTILTDKENNCGLDFSKTVVAAKAEHIDNTRRPHIRQNEFDVLKRLNHYDISRELKKYIRDYKRAKAHPEVPHNRELLKYSCLQYFEEYI